MRGFFVLVSLFFYCCIAVAQKTYDITYERATLNEGKFVLKSRFVFNDNFGLYYFYRGRDPYRNKTEFGKKIIHHAIFSDRSNEIQYYEVKFGPRDQYLYPAFYPSYKWIPVAGSKNLLGYECTGLLAITENNDSILVWYTKELGEGFGQAYYGIPGICLQSYDQRGGWKVTATKIKEESYKLFFPGKEFIRKKED